MEKVNKCSCFEENFVADYVATRNAGFGDVLYRKECRCRGTKEQDVCSCGGDELKCDFYPEKRKPKPCPFCGGEAEICEIERYTHPAQRFFPTCCNPNCLGRNLGKGYQTLAEALCNWNRREGKRK